MNLKSKIKKNPNIGVVILAAGSSSRMGAIKQLLPWKKSTLLGNAVEQALKSTAGKIFVVLGAHYEKIMEKVEFEGVHLLKNKNWQKGMGTSISLAIQFIEEQFPDLEAILFCVSDQPLVEYTYLNKLINNFIENEYKIVSTRINDKSGVPAIFDKYYFKELIDLDNDVGARKIISHYQKDVLVVDAVVDAFDIDDKKNYSKYYHTYGNI